MNTSRRTFVSSGLALTTLLAANGLLAAEPGNAGGLSAPPIRPEPKRGARQDLDTVFAFIRAGHGDLPKLQDMVTRNRRLVFAAWDWGDGDWETALGGAAHIGSRECADFLLAHGARIDAFCAAMLGQFETIAALVDKTPSIVGTRGPHGYTLLYHVAISGDVRLAETLRPHLAAEAKDYTQALSAAVRGGHLAMTRWLFAHGTVDPNLPDALGRRPLTTARAKGFSELAEELKKHGAIEG